MTRQTKRASVTPAPVRRFTIRVQDGATFACAADERVLVAMGQAGGRPIPVGCRRGGCGVCRVRVTEGAYSTAPMSATHVTPEEQAQGFALSCCIFPESDLVVELAPKPKRAAGVQLPIGATSSSSSDQISTEAP